MTFKKIKLNSQTINIDDEIKKKINSKNQHLMLPMLLIYTSRRLLNFMVFQK